MSPTRPSSLLRGVVLGTALVVAFLAGRYLAPPTDTSSSQETAATSWTCAMHPEVRQPDPGACPLCGMDLVPAGSGLTRADSQGALVLSDRARALARIRTLPVQRQGDAAAEIRLLGRVEPAETARRDLTTWIGGRIEDLRVNTTGEQVRKGQVLATLYSPEVYAAHQDLLTATRQVTRLEGASETAKASARSALEAARQRLRLLGVPEAEVDAMARAEDPQRTVTIRSPFAGTVIERVATEGAYVETGAPLYRVAALDTLWVLLDAYEADLSRLAVGQQVTLEVEGLPEQDFTGEVGFIDPTLDPERRTAGVRVVVENRDGLLRPGMFAQATVRAATTDAATALVVPATAPLFTGRRTLVYVEADSPEGYAYTPRDVRLGPRLGDVYPVVSGLDEGERVVVRGAFVLDADLQIRGGPALMVPQVAPDVSASPVELTPEALASLGPVVEAYLATQRALAQDDLPGAREAASRLLPALAEVTAPEASWRPLGTSLEARGREVAAATSLEAARGSFEPLSHHVETLLARFGNPLATPLHVAFCPMAQGDAGARWVQAGTTLDNAYFGAAMRTCGELRQTVSPGATLPAEDSR